MRVGLLSSAFVHVALILWSVFALPDAAPFDVEPVDSLPVDLVPISELTDLQKGVKTAELRETPSEAQTTPEPPPTPPPQPEPEPVGVQEAPQPTPPTPEPEQVAALPEPAAAEPPPPEPEPEPEPAPEPVQEQQPEPEPAPEPEAEAAEPLKPTPLPRLKPKPPKRKKTQTAKKTSQSDQVAALLNKVDPSGGGSRSSSQPASLGSRRGNDNARMTQSELDGLRSQISRCWNPPIGAADAEGLLVRVKMYLNRDGTVASPPKVENSSSNPFFRAAADSARRAVLRCQPYSLPADKYDAWQEVIMNFDPRELLGG